MAASWGFAIPLDAWVGLATSAGELPPAHGYARVEELFEYCADGVTLSNLATLQWPEALADWGNITTAPVYDAPTGGDLLFTVLFADAPLFVPQYARPRIRAGDISALLGTPSLPRGYGTGRYGRFAYGTQPNISATGTLELTFTPSLMCSSGTWQPFQCAA